MPTTIEHVAKASGNEAFAQSLTLDSQARIDWSLVATFYAAMHYVEAYLAKSGNHVRSHTTRDKYLGRDTQLRKIFNEYSDLKFYGYNARYEPPQFKAKDANDAQPKLQAIKNLLIPLL